MYGEAVTAASGEGVLKVCFLLQDTGFLFGAERATLDLARELRSRGEVDPVFLLIEETRLGMKRSRMREALDASGLRWEALSTSRRFSRRLVKAIRSHAETLEADVVHCIGSKAVVHGALAGRWGRDIPVIATVHGWLGRPDWKEQLYEKVEKASLRRLSATVTVSRYHRRVLADAGIPADRLVLLPSALSAEDLQGAESCSNVWTCPEPFVVGMAARYSDEKNHLAVIDAARRLIGEGISVRFLFAGEGPLKHRIREAVKTAGLGDDVDVVGYTERDAFFQRVHALLLFSRVENLPYCIMEAMAWRRPVVAARVGGIPELVDDGVTGFLVEPASGAEGLAACLRRLIADPARARRMGEAGRAKLESEFSIAGQVQGHVNLYRRLTEREAVA